MPAALPSTMPDFDFSDGLSEDWVSQRGSGPGTVASKPGRPNIAVLKADANRPPSRSSLSPAQAPDSLTRALAERTASQLNAPISTPNGTIQRGQLSSATQGLLWKRGNQENGVRLQPPEDLFSSIGLEKVFKPPTPNAQSPSPRRGKSKQFKATNDDSMPSSPPVIMPMASVGSRTGAGRRKSSLPIRSGAISASLSSIRETPEISETRKQTKAREGGDSLRARSQRGASAQSRVGSRSQHSARAFSRNTNESFSAIDLKSITISRESIKAADQKLQSKLGEKGRAGHRRPSSRLSDDGVDYDNTSQKQARREFIKDVLDSTARSQPEEDSVVHQVLKRASGFVTVHRGGYSSDDSFRRRPLSPSSYQQQSTPNLPSLPRRASVTTKPPRKEMEPPSTPTYQMLSPERAARSSGSPLKLFDQHDTFTKDHLTRRISQFQIAESHDSREPAELPQRLEEAAQPETMEQEDNEPSQSFHEDWRRTSGFGIGAMDNFNFTQYHSTPQIEKQLKQLRRSTFGRRSRSGTFISQRPSRISSRAASYHVAVNPSTGRSQIKIGKRQQRSPQKESSAKRPRTASVVDVAPVRMSLSRGQSVDSVAGKKRRDARYDDAHEPVDPEVIAARHMLRPKSANSITRTSNHSTVKPVGVKESATGPRAPMTIRAVEASTMREGGDVPGPSEVAAVWTRKKSITTADYFKEAKFVMDNLRQRMQPLSAFNAKRRSSAVRGVLEETVEPFTRPPSRENPGSRKEPLEMNSVVVRHLESFRESDDLGLDLKAPIQPLRSQSEGDVPVILQQSDPPNIRIIEKIAVDGQDVQHNSQKSSSSGAHTTHSVPTRLSGSSGTKTVIGPEKISHLIQQDVGKMTFDAKMHRWVKRTSVSKSQGHASSDPSEEDPLREIPDLVVDDDEEQQAKKSSTVSSSKSSRQAGRDDAGTKASELGDIQDVMKNSDVNDNSQTHLDNVESSRISFARVRPASQQAAQSPGFDSMLSMASATGAERIVIQSMTPVSMSSGDTQQTDLPSLGNEGNASRARTVMFSSPPTLSLSAMQTKQAFTSRRSTSIPTAATPRKVITPAHRTSTVAVIPEEPEQDSPLDEASVIRRHSTPEASMQSQPGSFELQAHETALAIANVHQTPPAKANDLLRFALNSSVAFHLSPLPSFTINQADESLNLDLNYVAKRKGLLSLGQVNGQFSLAVEKLVARIRDAEPNEPFWEYIRKISLESKELFTLHMLDEFCPRVEHLDINGNELGQINGAPPSLRTLSIRRNCLSDMTAWGHLHNLQYLDVSGNQFSSLKAFSQLVHLRELVAEDNQITGLEGILELNGLLKLNVSHNSIQSLRFGGCDLPRLTHLNCDDNSIQRISGLGQVPALQHLRLREFLLEHNLELPLMSIRCQ